MKIPNLTILTLNTPQLSDFAAERNRLLRTAQTDWVFFLDQDEVMTPALLREISRLLRAQNSRFYSAYAVPRLDTFLGKVLRHGEAGTARFVRLAKRDWGQWQGRVHEVWVGKGLVGTLKNPLLHTPHLTLAAFVTKIDRYSTLAAQERYEQGIKPNLLQLLFYPVAKFFLNYFLRRGFQDGVPGTIHALMMSWHSFQTHTKNYLLWHQK